MKTTETSLQRSVWKGNWTPKGALGTPRYVCITPSRDLIFYLSSFLLFRLFLRPVGTLLELSCGPFGTFLQSSWGPFWAPPGSFSGCSWNSPGSSRRNSIKKTYRACFVAPCSELGRTNRVCCCRLPSRLLPVFVSSRLSAGPCVPLRLSTS